MDKYAIFEELYKKYNSTVLWNCYWNEDYAQDVWLEIWKHIRRGTLLSTDAAYMNKAIRQNAHISYYSKKHRPFEAYTETFFKEEWQTVPDIAHDIEFIEWLKGLFERLEPKESETLKLIIMGYNCEEISQMQKNTRQFVSNTKRRAQRKAKKYASSK